MDLLSAVKSVSNFEGQNLKYVLSAIERDMRNTDLNGALRTYSAHHINHGLLEAAITLKKQIAQINVVIHAVGMLICLPSLLQSNEVIESMSLGAGNTGRIFDLETNIQIAEFKFIDWKGGSESIRQNSLFKDFYNLAEYETSKRRVLYVVGLTHPIKFFRGNRKIESVLSRNNKLWTQFKALYGSRFLVVNEYYKYRKPRVELIDISDIIRINE